MTNPLTPHLDWLYNRQAFGIKPGLERLEVLLERLGNPHHELPVALIGGTNGKGTVARLVAATAQRAGRTVGLFTSPHLHEFRERIIIDGALVSTADLTALLERVRPLAEEIGATFFEIVTALAFLAFRERNVDLAVLEVGLGGTYDATNIAHPMVSAVVSVGLDHTEILGDTLTAIAHDKAGIFRADVPAVTGATGEALAELTRVATATGTPLTNANDYAITVSEHNLNGQRFTLQDGEKTVAFTTPLIGVHQPANIAVAYGVAQALTLNTEAFVEAVRTTTHPARLEVITTRGTTWLLDGAHNEAAAQALVRTLAEIAITPNVLILATSGEKDQAAIAHALAAVAENVVVTQAMHSPRATPPADLAARIPGAIVAPTPDEALEQAEQLANGGTVLIAGSLFSAAEMRATLLHIRPEGVERLQ